MNTPPRIKLAHLPTPIEELPRLSAALGGPRILIKRDDQTGLAFGGNKTRKLEFLLGEAKEQGATMLITGGAVQSNHCRQTAAAAARCGMKCKVVLSGPRPSRPTANLFLDRLFGAEVIFVEERSQRDQKLRETFEASKLSGEKPYLITYGGSSPTGALGYAYAVDEFLKQNVPVDSFVFASSSGGTHAGLLLGQRVFGFAGKVLGISIDETESDLKHNVAKLASGASAKLGLHETFSPDDVLANDSYIGPGYGVLTTREREAVQLFARHEGMLLDPVYTGRAAAGLIDLIRNGYFSRDETVLFWNTGGQPALLAEQYMGELL
jgi:D-cysteine desulfhydrase family pyridoxal phosphate-dependent enzyme